MDGKRPTVASLNGIVAAAHPLAAQAGVRLLAEGGNAFDAAAATAAALNVVEPYMSGLGGMGMATCYIAAEKRIRTLDFVTRVPSRFPKNRFKERAELARGAQGAGTPGSLAGWCELVRAYGRKSLAQVFAPAIALARDGFPLVEFNVAEINSVAIEFKSSRPELLPAPLPARAVAPRRTGHGRDWTGNGDRSPAPVCPALDISDRTGHRSRRR